MVIDGTAVDPRGFSEAARHTAQSMSVFRAIVAGEFHDRDGSSHGTGLGGVALIRSIWHADETSAGNDPRDPAANIIIARKVLNDAEVFETSEATELVLEYTAVNKGRTASHESTKAIPKKPIVIINNVIKQAELSADGRLAIGADMLEERVLPYLRGVRGDTTKVSD